MANVSWCPSCRTAKVSGQPCETCARRARYGVLVDAALAVDREVGSDPDAWLCVLDAIAEMMIERHRLLRAHRRELNAGALETSRAAREAYQDGRADARAEEDWS